MPYWRLSAFYFFYFAQLGALLPYLTLYLKDRGFNIDEIGMLTAILMATKIVAPNLWTFFSEKLGVQILVLRLGALLSGLVFSSIFFLEGFWQFAGLLFGFSFFRNGILPQIEVLTLGHLGSDTSRYGRVRLWGSVGYMVSVMGLGVMFDSYSAATLPNFLAVIMLAIIVMSFLIPAIDHQPQRAFTQRLRDVVYRREVIAFLLVCCLIQISHGPYYTFYTLLLESEGFSKTIIGSLWALGVLAEVILFIFIHHLFRSVSEYQILSMSAGLTVFRWVLIAYFPGNLVILIFAQLLHAASYGSFHAASMRIVRSYFPGRLEAHGQALYASASFGLGGALGALYAGYCWEYYGANFSYLTAAVMCVVTCIVSLRWVRPVKQLEIQPQR